MKTALLLVGGMVVLTSSAIGQESKRLVDSSVRVDAPYKPIIRPADFTHVINNRYLRLKPGTKVTYEMRAGAAAVTPTPDKLLHASLKGITRVEMIVTGKTTVVMGVTTLVVLNREWIDDQLVEETSDWVAQDREGNVWQFGEAVRDYRAGTPLDEVSWKAGEDGAEPGILMLGNPKVGDTFHQEYRRGKSEDIGTVVAVGKPFAIHQGPFFADCVQIRYSSLDGETEDKYNCVGVGITVLEESGPERLTLVSLETERIPRLRGTVTRFAQR